MSQSGRLGKGGGAGGGDVTGPATATDNALARYDGTTGKLIQNSLVVLDDAGAMSGLTGLTVTGTTTLNGVANGTAIDPVGAGVYGDGSDGTQTFDGSSVVLGITPSSSTYTLARDIFLAAGTINSGVTIITNGFRIFCSGTLTNNGTVSWNGNAGTNTGVAGLALSNTSSSFNTATGANAAGTVGGAGNVGAGSNAGGNTSASALGGSGGAGGAGGSTGGTGTTITAPAASIAPPRMLPFISLAISISGVLNTLASWKGGAGGGGGGGDASIKGGGGGSGAGVVVLVCLRIAGTGNIQAIGGNGGAGGVGGTNCGGGGGGGGGLILITSRSVVSGAISGQTLSVAGGNLGSPTGTGHAGTNGSSGTAILLAN